MGKRQDRYQEYLQLKSLPFLSEEQGKRFRYLKQQRRRDNKRIYSTRNHKPDSLGLLVADECEKVCKGLERDEVPTAEIFGSGCGFAAQQIYNFSKKWWDKLESNSDGTIDDEETFLEELENFIKN